jgi:hypothetical protein
VSSPRSEPRSAPNSGDNSSANKVLSLRQLLRRERRMFLLVWSSVALLFVLISGLIVTTVALGSDAFSGPESVEKAFSFALFVAMMLFALTLPFLSYPFLYRPAKTRRLMQRCLSPYGDPEKLIDEIDIELRDRSFVRDAGLQPDRLYRQTTGHLIFTERWLLWFGWSEFRFLSIADVFWFYKRIEVQPRLWGTSDRIRNYLVCVTGRGEPHHLRLFNDEYVDEAIYRLLRRRPEALCGFQAEWQALAATQPAALRQMVAERRQEWEHLSAARRADWKDERFDDACLYIRRVDSSSSPEERRY